MSNNFTYKSKYETYENCYFQLGRYMNNNIALEIWNNEYGPITKVTVNPDFGIPEDYLAIKNYSENDGMVEFLISLDIIVESPITTINSGWVEIPVHRITDTGKKILGLI